jgi:hypothetical protein
MESARVQGAVLKCGRPCEFEYVGNGKFRAHDPALGFDLEMDADMLARSFQNAARALDRYYRTADRSAEIIPFRRRAG